MKKTNRASGKPGALLFQICFSQKGNAYGDGNPTNPAAESPPAYAVDVVLAWSAITTMFLLETIFTPPRKPVGTCPSEVWLKVWEAADIVTLHGLQTGAMLPE